MPLFEVAVITKPCSNAIDGGARPGIILKPTAVIATDATAAAAQAGALVGARMIGAPASSDSGPIGETEVLVRPFK